MYIKRKYTVLRSLKSRRRMSAATFWSEVGTRAVSYLCAVIIMTIILSVTVSADIGKLNQICMIVAAVLALLWSIPVLRFTRLRLRDAGYTPKAYLWLLLPVIGWGIFAVLLCAKGVPQTSDSAVEVL